MKILQVLDSFSFGGAENLVVQLAHSAPRHWDVRAASLAPFGVGRDAMLDQFRRAGLRPFSFGVRRLADPVGFARLTRTLRRLRPDVVHAHLGYAATMVPPAARLAGVPCVATLHHVPHDLSRVEWLKERLSVRIPGALGRLIVVSSPAYAAFAERHGPPTARWQVIHNGVDLERFARPHGAGARHRPVWVAVAALRAPKGHLDLLTAWRTLADEGVDATLLIVGDGPERGAIEQRVHELELTDRVELLGRRDDVPDILAQADGAVSASHTEALPTALIEAAAAGLPVVATTAGGTTDVVTDSTGWLVPAHEPDALASALAQAILRPEEAARRGAAGRRRAVELFSMASWIDALEEIYTGRQRVPAAVRQEHT